ncbi:MAG: hypothetical protein U0W40_07675 [Acidimicrobiia bacterium]
MLLVLLALWIARACRPDREPWPVLLPLTLGAPVFLFLVDIRRSGLGVPSAGSSLRVDHRRAHRAGHRVRHRRACSPTRSLALSVLRSPRRAAARRRAERAERHRAERPPSRENERRLVAAVDLLRSGDRVLSISRSPSSTPTSPTPLALARDGAAPGITVSGADRLAAAMSLQVVGRLDSTAAPRTPGEGAIEEVSGATNARSTRSAP